MNPIVSSEVRHFAWPNLDFWGVISIFCKQPYGPSHSVRWMTFLWGFSWTAQFTVLPQMWAEKGVLHGFWWGEEKFCELSPHLTIFIFWILRAYSARKTGFRSNKLVFLPPKTNRFRKLGFNLIHTKLSILCFSPPNYNFEEFLPSHLEKLKYPMKWKERIS
jgi:hypothetical protein